MKEKISEIEEVSRKSVEGNKLNFHLFFKIKQREYEEEIASKVVENQLEVNFIIFIRKQFFLYDS